MFILALGEPNSSASHPDFVPSVFPSVYKSKSPSLARLQRYNRRLCRATSCSSLGSTQPSNDVIVDTQATCSLVISDDVMDTQASLVVCDNDQCQHDHDQSAGSSQCLDTIELDVANTLVNLSQSNMHTDECAITSTSHGTQTDDVMAVDEETQTQMEIDASLYENACLRKKVFGISYIDGNDGATSYYTGLPTSSMFLHVYLFLSPDVSPSKVVSLEEELFAVLCCLRLNCKL
jgi:hypothetical protein